MGLLSRHEWDGLLLTDWWSARTGEKLGAHDAPVCTKRAGPAEPALSTYTAGKEIGLHFRAQTEKNAISPTKWVGSWVSSFQLLHDVDCK